MDKQINVVLSTMDYEKFSFFEENREINMARVKELEKSMEKHPLEKAIDVNENLKVIDGQHRFTAWRNRGMPIIYIVHRGWGAKEIPVLNVNQKNWVPSDFLDLYIKMGKKEYEVYKHFDDHWGFTHNVNLLLLCGGEENAKRKAGDRFNKGQFKATNLNKANEFAKLIHSLKTYYSGYKRRTFVAAFIKLVSTPGYDHDHLLGKLTYQSRKLVDCTTVDEYYDLLKEVYNYKIRNGEQRI